MSLPDKYIKDDASSQTPCGLCTPECGDPKSLSASKPETWNLNSWSSESHRACTVGRVVTRVNEVKPETGEALWFPLRIFHSSEKRQTQLEALLREEPAVEQTYVPRNLVDAEQQTYVSALKNYIFVRITLAALRQLKADRQQYATLRYIMQPTGEGVSEIAHVPDKQMEDFIRVIAHANEQVVMIENMAFACKPGQSVRIRRGAFEGVEGTVKSIKKHLCVVIPVRDIMAVAILNVPKKDIEVV